jgi:hypothetical protein
VADCPLTKVPTTFISYLQARGVELTITVPEDELIVIPVGSAIPDC